MVIPDTPVAPIDFSILFCGWGKSSLFSRASCVTSYEWDRRTRSRFSPCRTTALSEKLRLPSVCLPRCNTHARGKSCSSFVLTFRSAAGLRATNAASWECRNARTCAFFQEQTGCYKVELSSVVQCVGTIDNYFLSYGRYEDGSAISHASSWLSMLMYASRGILYIWISHGKYW